MNDLIWGSFDFIIKGNSLIGASQSSLHLTYKKTCPGSLASISDAGVDVYFGGNYKGRSSFNF